jgi:tetratricopeptide (TPR) repeat protein
MTFSFADADLYLAALGVCAAAAAAWRLRRSRPAYALAAGFFAAAYFPVSNAAVLIGTVMGDRLMYLPSAAFCLAAAAALADGAAWLFRGRAAAAPLAIGCAALACAGAYVGYSARWHDDETLFTYAAERVPRSYKMQFARGNLVLERDPALALTYYAAAAKIAPRSADLEVNVATALARLGRDAEALSHYRAAMEEGSAWPYLPYDLGRCYLRLGKPRQAAEAFRRFLQGRPPSQLDAEALLSRAAAAAAAGDP